MPNIAHYQNISLIGTIVKDAEKITSKSGVEYVSVRLVCNSTSGDKEESTFYSVSYPYNGWYPHLKKGVVLYVSGLFKIKRNIKDGKEYTDFLVNARDIRPLTQVADTTFRKEDKSGESSSGEPGYLYRDLKQL